MNVSASIFLLWCWGVVVAPLRLNTSPGYRGLVTFDLDDCVWPIIPVVSRANKAVETAFGLDHKDVQRVIKDIRISSQRPVSYGKARLLAYERLLQTKSTSGASHERHTAQECFKVWLQARNNAGGDLLFPDVVPCLEELTLSGWLVGAITNGLGDPSSIAPLEPFIKFCVSGEDDNVFPHRKPAKQIFEAAADSARLLGVNVCTRGHDEPQERSQGPSEQRNGAPWWHVGDDLANDVAGAQRLGIKTLLLERPLSSPEAADVGKDGGLPGNPNPFSTANAQDLASRSAMAAKARPDVTLTSLDTFSELLGASD